MAEGTAYGRAGVDLAAGQRATQLIKAAVGSTYGPEVLSGVGHFGGLYDGALLAQMAHPVLVASTDGVGTKTSVASRLGRWESIGQDLVNHCVNDILVQGARPLFFLDYIASAHLNPEQVATIVEGIARACRRVGCALLGGETAEMPGIYQAGEVDIAGTIVGVVERDRIIDGSRIRPDDVIVGLPSTGLHTNGYSLARQVLARLDWTHPPDGWESSLGEVLLAPHRCYLEPIAALWSAGIDIHGLVHITGGGLVDNPPRIFPHGLGARLWRGSWPEPPLFGLIQRLGDISDEEMFHVFNMGLGMLLILPPAGLEEARQLLGQEMYLVGRMVSGADGVEITED